MIVKRTYRKSLSDFESRNGKRTTKEFIIKDLPEKRERSFFDIRTGTTYLVDLTS